MLLFLSSKYPKSTRIVIPVIRVIPSTNYHMESCQATVASNEMNNLVRIYRFKNPSKYQVRSQDTSFVIEGNNTTNLDPLFPCPTLAL